MIENAIRYNRDRGTVRIDAQFAEAPADSWAPAVISVRVTDQGWGIPPSDVHRVFERFYRVDASRNRHTGGAGLGLAIAREVLAVFHGSIQVEQSSSHGTTLAIRLPGRREAHTRTLSDTSEQSPAMTQGAAGVAADVRPV